MMASALAWAEPPGIASRAWVLIDQASGRELAAHQADLPLAPASLTQLMTAYVLLDDIRKNKLSLGESVTVPEAATQVDGARVFLKAGDQVSVDTLLQAMLLESASDATLTLVTSTDGSEAAFVARMNSMAKRLGMSKTRFMNATGLTEPGHESSARDLALLGARWCAISPAARRSLARKSSPSRHHLLQRQSAAVARQHGNRSQGWPHARGRVLPGGRGPAG